MKISDYKQKKKQEEDEQISKVSPAKHIQKLKMSLGIMAHDLFTNKKIGKALYSKMMNLTYDRTREETLKTNIDVLTSIEDNVQSNISKREKVKKVSHKDFKQIKEVKKKDKSNVYNVFIKFNMMVEEDEEELKPKTLNTTLKIIGKDNIKNDLKDLIDFQMKNIYVQSVEILDVIANKDVIQSDIYKWTGTEQFEGDIKYFKARNSNFNYHNFNLDINNEIPFECVPNALIISYGNRQSKKQRIYS